MSLFLGRLDRHPTIILVLGHGFVRNIIPSAKLIIQRSSNNSAQPETDMHAHVHTKAPGYLGTCHALSFGCCLVQTVILAGHQLSEARVMGLDSKLDHGSLR